MDTLSRTFAALSDPTRRRILTRLMEGEASFTDLADPLPMSRPAVVKHLKALEAAGLIDKDDAARPTYRLNAAAMREGRDWLEGYARFWEGSLDRLDDYVAQIQSATGGKA